MRSVEVAEAIRERRARRVISERPLETEVVRALVASARLSASCFNNQPWRLVFCTGTESLARVKAALAKGNAWATRAPLIVAVAARADDDCQLSEGRDYFLFDCGLAIGQFELMATQLGLIAHPIAGFNPSQVRQALGVPDGYVVIALVICGYPGDDDSLLSEKQKESEKDRPVRKPEGDNFFQDEWSRPLA